MYSADQLLDQCMYFTTARLHRALDKLVADCFAASGLAPNQAFLLMTVQDRPGVTAGELAKALHLSPSTLTRFLDKLESRALVRRAKEGRSAKVEVTAKGARLRPALEADALHFVMELETHPKAFFHAEEAGQTQIIFRGAAAASGFHFG